jgi:hypothetical protein
VIRKVVQDPYWEEIAASLRKESLYVKMSRQKVLILIKALRAEDQDLYRKGIEESDRSFVFSGPPVDWVEDLEVLQTLEPSGILAELIAAILAGLRNDSMVDWITRAGGPPPERDDFFL